MIPHERSLVERMQGKPFVLLGVNGDDTREELRETVQDKEINWRNWWDGNGKIQEAYGVDGYPTIYLIDARGRVQQMFEGAPRDRTIDRALAQLGEQLDVAIDRLVGEAERDAAVSATAPRAETAP
jgi:hypothetical protein